MKIIVSSTSTGVYVQKTVNAYNRKGYLIKFYTSLFDHKDSVLSIFLNKIGLFKSVRSRRNVDTIPINLVEGLSFFELLRTMAARFGFSKTAHWIWERSEWIFDYWVSRKLSEEAEVLHSYEHVSLRSFKRAKELGVFCVYEQTSAHYEFFDKMYTQQLELYPAFKQDSRQLLDKDSLAKMRRLKNAELKLADLIICNSKFTKNTLVAAGVNESKIEVIPLGFPTISGALKNIGGKFVILFAGNLSLHKGVHHLIEVWRKSFSQSPCELWLVGQQNLPDVFVADLPSNIKRIGNVPSEEMDQIYAQASALVLPTLADGFGMVITEAMAKGLCVIATRNSAGPDIISNEVDGLVIDANDPDALRGALSRIISDIDFSHSLGDAAREKARLYSWDDYQEKLVDTIEKRFEDWKAK